MLVYADDGACGLEAYRFGAPGPIFSRMESFHFGRTDAHAQLPGFQRRDVKLVKTAGVTGASDALQARAGRSAKRCSGCMIETSILISACARTDRVVRTTPTLVAICSSTRRS